MNYRLVELPYGIASAALFSHFRSQQLPVLLRSNPDGFSYQYNRWDIISANPVSTIEFPDSANSNAGALSVQAVGERVSAELQRYTSCLPSGELPFCSGAIGVVSYPAGESWLGVERDLPATSPSANWPDTLVGIYQWAIVTDHLTGKRWLAADPRLAEQEWQALFDETLVAIALASEHSEELDSDCADFALQEDWQTSLDFDDYGRAFDRLKEYILAGDCYQSNLTRQFHARYRGHPWSATRLAWQRANAPFSAYIGHDNSALLSCSPECFIQIQQGKVTTRPIKGTRPRGLSVQEDSENARSLHRSVKDRAENLMIVDLMRNDLGRYSRTGSVAVPSLFDIESFSNVHHMVSTVTGQIEANNPAQSLATFLGCLPGGSITGAPKKRAMEIIAELEPHRRSIYCGSLFYLNSSGDLNSNILIRSLLFDSETGEEGTVFCWSGGGIVADSTRESEFAESQVKVQHLLDALARRG